MKIRDVMTADIEVVTPDDTLTTATRLMADLNFEALPVEEDNRLVGLISARDIAIRVAANGLDPEATTVRRAMSTDLLYCFENESAEDVSQKMGGWWVRRLAVVKQDKRLIGMVSLADLTALNAEPKPIRMLLRRYKAARPARQTRRACRKAAAA